MIDIPATLLMCMLLRFVVSTSSYVVKICLMYLCYKLLNFVLKHLFISIASFSRHKAASRNSKLFSNPLLAVVPSVPSYFWTCHSRLFVRTHLSSVKTFLSFITENLCICEISLHMYVRTLCVRVCVHFASAYFTAYTHYFECMVWVPLWYIYLIGARGGAVVEALRYKPEGRGFDSRWCHWSFSFT
jgi:hypothetical protein